MEIRPIDIARKLGVSTTTLRVYEDMGLVPATTRTCTGYREYTEEHVAYFICIRAMLPAFDLTFIKSVLSAVQKNDMDTAFVLLNKAQADLWNDRQIAQRFSQKIKGTQNDISKKDMTINEVSEKTGIPTTTIRYWEKVGLIAPIRNPQNKYRLYNDTHIEQLLTLYSIKLSIQTHRGKHFISSLKEEYHSFDRANTQQTELLNKNITAHINQMVRMQIKASAALYSLCEQVESKHFISA